MNWYNKYIVCRVIFFSTHKGTKDCQQLLDAEHKNIKSLIKLNEVELWYRPEKIYVRLQMLVCINRCIIYFLNNISNSKNVKVNFELAKKYFITYEFKEQLGIVAKCSLSMNLCFYNIAKLDVHGYYWHNFIIDAATITGSLQGNPVVIQAVTPKKV